MDGEPERSGMQFDVVVTNPPFQDSVRRKKTPHKLWIDFTAAAFERLLVEGGSLIQVSPASFSSPSSIVLDLMAHHRTRVLRFGAGRHFPGIDSTFASYWIVNAPNDGAPTTVVTADADFELPLDPTTWYLPNDLCDLSMSVHTKVMFTPRERLRVERDYVTAHNIRRFGVDPTLSEQPSERHCHPVFHTNRSTWWSSIRQAWADEPKVMWTRSGHTRPFFDPGRLGGTDMVYFVRVASDREGETLVANLDTALLRYVLRTARWSGFGNERVFAGLPALPLDRVLTDDEMFEAFGITAEEVGHVRDALAPRRRAAR